MKDQIGYKALVYFKDHRFLLLLIFLVAGIAIPAFLQDKGVRNLVATIIFSLAILSGLYAFAENTRFLRTGAVFFILAIIVAWISFFRTGDGFFEITQSAFFVIVFITLLIKTLISINKADEADLNVIFGSLVGYMLMGYLGGFSAIGISAGYPDSFNVSAPLSTMEGIYYSFVTMTTLGYGDIIPIGHQARSLSILLSIIGPMYIAILIAMLVGKYASRKSGD